MRYETYERPTIISAERLESAIEFVMSKLNIRSKIIIYFDGDDFAGTVLDFTDDQIEIQISPYQSEKEILYTVFHEMVHAKQFENGELIFADCFDGAIFRGNLITEEEMDDIDPKSLPWEIEAYAAEKELYEAFLQHEERTEK